MQNLISDVSAYVFAQLRKYGSAVIRAGIIIELQGRGAFVQTDVLIPVPFAVSWSDAKVIVGHARVDCVVTVGKETVALELVPREPPGNVNPCEPNLVKYIDVISPAWGIVLLTEHGTKWIRPPTAR